MIKFEDITLQNFMSYGNNSTTVGLERSEPTLISGINYDASSNNELDSNGAGKSTILIALSVALYDKPIGLKQTKKADLINNINKKDMLITVNLTANKKKYTIHRFRKNKAMGGDGVLILENGKDITPTGSNADKFIAEKIMNMPYEIFSKIIVYSAGHDAFLKMSLGEQREILEELFSYKELSRKAEVLKEEIKTNKTNLKYAKDTNEEIRKEAERLKNQLEEAEQDYALWEKEHAEKIKEVKQIIKDFSGLDFDSQIKIIEEIDVAEKEKEKLQDQMRSSRNEQKRLMEDNEKYFNFEEDNKSQVKKLKKKLKDLDITEDEIEENKKLLKALDKKEEEFKKTNQNAERAIDEIDTVLNKIKKLGEEVAELSDSNCPYCKQQYADAAKKKKEVDAEREQQIKRQKELEEDKNAYIEKSKKIDEELSEIKKSLVFDSMDQLELFVRKRDKIATELEQAEKAENPYEDKTRNVELLDEEIKDLDKEIEEQQNKIESLRKQSSFTNAAQLYDTKSQFDQANDRLEYLKNETNPHEKLVENLSNQEGRENKDDEIDELIDEIKHQEFLLKLLTKKDSFVRKALMDKYLPFLNERLKYYLSKMGLPHKVKFKSDMSTEISQFGKEISHGMLSSGQKARIDIALSLAFRDVLQSKHSFINLYILDECLDVGLSNVGIKKTLKVIKDVAKENKLSMLVISHRDEIKPAFNERIDIELKDGFSTIKKPS